MTLSWRPGSPTSPCSPARGTLLFVLLAGIVAPARAEVLFEVGGALRPSEEGIAVEVEISNRGDQAVPSLEVRGELFGREDEARLTGGIAAGAGARVVLRFPDEPPRPGVHALTLLLEYPEGATTDATGTLSTGSQRAYLLLALGANPPPAVRLAASEIVLDAVGTMHVDVEGLDGAPHRVRLRALTARGLHADGPPQEIDVGASGKTAASLVLRRAAALRGSRHGVLIVADTVDGPLARAAVASGAVVIAPEPGLLPRLRWPLLALAAVLMGAALVREFASPRAPADA